jgi:pyrroloquinoline quinone (PQQ) biosynthesis protein C
MSRTPQWLDEALDGRRLLSHPFYRRWEQGGLTTSELRDYAEQYRYFESALPEILARVMSQAPEGAKNAVAENLADELGPPSHLELFEGFASFFDATNATISTAMTGLLDAYDAELRRGPNAALAAVVAYEAQGAEIARSKAEGLAQRYGAPSSATEFWDVHAGVEDDHAGWLIDAINEIGMDAESAFTSARAVADAWWAFLDEREALVAG